MSALAKLDRPVLLSARVLAALAFLAPLLRSAAVLYVPPVVVYATGRLSILSA